MQQLLALLLLLNQVISFVHKVPSAGKLLRKKLPKLLDQKQYSINFPSECRRLGQFSSDKSLRDYLEIAVFQQTIRSLRAVLEDEARVENAWFNEWMSSYSSSAAMLPFDEDNYVTQLFFALGESNVREVSLYKEIGQVSMTVRMPVNIGKIATLLLLKKTSAYKGDESPFHGKFRRHLRMSLTLQI